jgi:hypothetical protein
MWGADIRARGVPNAGWKDSKNFFSAKFLAQSEEATTVISVQPVSVTMTKSSGEKQPDVAKVVVGAETAVAKIELSSGLNMQLKRVRDETCNQTLCMVKGKACKLMVDRGSYCNCVRRIRSKRIYFPVPFCCCFSSNLCVLNTINMD